MEVVINGIRYQSIEKPKRPKGYSKLHTIMAMGMMFGGQGMVGGSKEPERPKVDIIKEYELIQNKQSLLSKSQRDWVIYQFESNFKPVGSILIPVNPDAECGLCQKEIPEGDGYCDDCKGQI